jgi:hypothetical protein
MEKQPLWPRQLLLPSAVIDGCRISLVAEGVAVVHTRSNLQFNQELHGAHRRRRRRCLLFPDCAMAFRISDRIISQSFFLPS